MGKFETLNVPLFQDFFSVFNFGTNLGLRARKFSIKLIFDIKIEFGILEILDCQISLNPKHF